MRDGGWQGMIEDPDRNWESHELPTIFSNRTSHDVKTSVIILHELAQKLKKRFAFASLVIF